MIAWLAASALAGSCSDDRIALGATDRLAVFGGGLTETVFAFGAGARVVGTDATSTFPPEATLLPRVGYYRSLTAEGVVSLGADLVLVGDDAGPPAVLDQLRATGARVCVLPSDPSLEGAVERIAAIGHLLGESAQATALVDDIRRRIAAIEAPAASVRVLFVYARGVGALQVSGSGTSADAMLRLVGATNAVDAWEGYRPLTAEALIAAAPDVILLTTTGLASIGGQAGLLAVPGVALTPAGTHGRIVAMDDLLLLGFGPRTGLAAETLAASLAIGGR